MGQRNLVAKHAGMHRASTHKDRKKGDKLELRGKKHKKRLTSGESFLLRILKY